MNRLRNIEWEAVAGIAAAVVALVLHLLSVVEQDVLLTIVLVILAIMARSRTRDVPRYIFRVYGNSELIPRLLDMERQYRLKRD
jgi:hypothetical protein